MASTNNLSSTPPTRRVRKSSSAREKSLDSVSLLTEVLAEVQPSKETSSNSSVPKEELKTFAENKPDTERTAETDTQNPSTPYYLQPGFRPAFVPCRYYRQSHPLDEAPYPYPEIRSKEEIYDIAQRCREFDFKAASHLVEEAEAAGWNKLAERLEVVPFETKRIKKRKAGKDTLLKKHGYYIVPFLGKFYYYKIDPVIDSAAHFFRFGQKLPPVLREGIVYVNKQAYFVTLEDLRRKLVRKSNLLPILKTSPTYDDFYSGAAFQPFASSRKNTSSATEDLIRSLTEDTSDASIDGDGSGSFIPRGEDLASANGIVQSQAETLLNTLLEEENKNFFEEEEWEIS